MLAAIRWSQAAWTLALLLQLLLAGPGGCLSRQELFPFGPGHGDLELEAGDDLVSPALELSTALRFFDKSNIHSIYVSATPGGRWEQSGGRAWKAEAASEGRPRRAGGANEAGRTWASWAGTARPASLWGAGCGARFPSPVGFPPPSGLRRLPAACSLSREGHSGLGSSPRRRHPVCALSHSRTPRPHTLGPGRNFLSRGCGQLRPLGSPSASCLCLLPLKERRWSGWDQAWGKGQS